MWFESQRLPNDTELLWIASDIKDSIVIKNEIRVSRTKEMVFIPILAEELIGDKSAQGEILNTFTTKELALWIQYQWLRPSEGYKPRIQTLIDYLATAMA